MVDVVKISVEISAEKATAGAKRVQKATGDMAKSFKAAEDAAKKTEKSVSKAGKAAGDSAPRWEKAGRSVQELAANLAVVQGPLGPLAGRVRTLGAIMGRLPIVATAASITMTTLAVTFKASLTAGARLETQLNKLQAVVKATGGTAGLTANEMDRFSRELARATLASSEGVRNAAIQLATFRSVSGETFKETLRLAQDLSAAGFGSLETSAKSLGRALEDPAVGLSALRRVGVSFSREQTEVISKLVKTGEVAQAQALILEGVRVQVEGLAEAAADSLVGAADSLSQSWTELLETFADRSNIVQHATDFIKGLTNAVMALDDAIQEDFSLKILLDAQGGLKDAEAELKRLKESRALLIEAKLNVDVADAGELTTIQQSIDSIDAQIIKVTHTAANFRSSLTRDQAALASAITRDAAELARYERTISDARKRLAANPLNLVARNQLVNAEHAANKIRESLKESRAIQQGYADELKAQGDVQAAALAQEILLRGQAIAKLEEQEQAVVKQIKNELEVAGAGKISLDIAKKREQLMRKIAENPKIREESKESVMALVNAMLNELQAAYGAGQCHAE
jgi:hypothetical protein